MEENVQDKEMTFEEWKDKFDRIRALHPEFKEPEEVECLDLIMRKEFALDIVEGRKHVEFRSATDFYNKRLMASDVLEAAEKYADDEEVKEILDGRHIASILDPIRIVKRIHFHNYNNTWSLDVEVVDNHLDELSEPLAVFIMENYGYDDIVDAISELEEDENHPFVYYFVLGKIINKVNL